MPHANSYRNDDELLEGLRRGEAGSFEAFFDRFADRLYGFGLKVCGRGEEAREILQDTLVTALKSVKEVKHAKALPRWLFRLATNACLTRLPEGDLATSHETPLEDLMPGQKDGGPVPLHDWSLDPDEEARRSEEKRLLKEAVAELPPPYRLVLVLRDMEEMSNNDVSEILQVPVSTVRTRLHRARLLLRNELTRRLLAGHGSGSVRAT